MLTFAYSHECWAGVFMLAAVFHVCYGILKLAFKKGQKSVTLFHHQTHVCPKNQNSSQELHPWVLILGNSVGVRRIPWGNSAASSAVSLYLVWANNSRNHWTTKFLHVNDFLFWGDWLLAPEYQIHSTFNVANVAAWASRAWLHFWSTENRCIFPFTSLGDEALFLLRPATSQKGRTGS